MKFTVFYAWESDRSEKINKDFILDAANKAIGKIKEDINSKGDDIEIVHGTTDIPGSPIVISKILERIDKCHIFLADVTYVAKIKKTNEKKEAERKKIANPNVLFEFGYAWSKVGCDYIICVMNEAYGSPKDQIFDLRPLEWPITYNLKLLVRSF